LVLLPRPVCLHDLAALAVADVAGELVPGLLDGELPVHLSAVGVVDRVDDPEQVQGLGDPYSANACPKGVGRPSRPNIRSRSYARTCPHRTCFVATTPMPGHDQITAKMFLRLYPDKAAGGVRG
jgi:hypothetical protein